MRPGHDLNTEEKNELAPILERHSQGGSGLKET